jgi:hypothetical protein
VKFFVCLAVFAYLLCPIGAGVLAQDYDPTQLTFSSATDRHPTWTPDGQWVIFESNRSGIYHLYRVPAAGGTEEQLSFGSVHEYHPNISTDGTKIVFVRSECNPSDCSLSTLWVMPVGGGTATQLLDYDGHLNWHPAWSPDGQYVYYDGRDSGDWNIYRIPAVGGAPTLMVDISVDARVTPSPDGTMIAYMTSVGGAYNTVQAPVASPESYTRVTFETKNTTPETYTPDGRYLVVASRKISSWMELFKVDLVDNSMVRLTYDVESSSSDPLNQLAAIDPTGTKLAYSSNRVAGNANIWILDMTVIPPPSDVLSVQAGLGLGGASARVPIALTSTVSSPALEFRVHDLPDWLTVTGVEMEGRAASMSASFVNDGSGHVLVYSTAGGVIPVGAGVILNLVVEVDPTAVLGDSVAVTLSDIVMSDAIGHAVAVFPQDGHFYIERIAGDINMDNLVDVGDLVRLVEIILGTGAVPSPEELTEADCNGDGFWNALDVPCLLSLILGGSGSPLPGVTPLAAEGALTRFLLENEVRGIQFELPATVGEPSATSELGPLVLQSGRRADGKRIVIAFDPAGGAWTPGVRTPFSLSSAPLNLRAYGEGGRALTVSYESEGIRIGVTPPAKLRMLPPAPNPFRAGTMIRFATPTAGPVRVTIYDIRGVRVSSLPERTVPAGDHEWKWTPIDSRGRSLAAGFYLAVVESAGQRASVRLTHLGD